MSKRSYVLVVGETQAGKSTFIRLIHSVNGVPIPDGLKSGTGELSCTVVSTIYSITHKAQVFEFPVTSPVNSQEEWLDAICKVEPVLGKEHDPHELSIYDTPGLNDSGGSSKDEDNVVSILQALTEQEDQSYITAVLFVVKKGTPLTDSFQKCFQYYRQLLANVSDRFIFVHTNWSPLVEDSTKLRDRTTIFDTKLGGTFKHFYIDTVINEVFNPRKNPFPAVAKALTVNTLNQILQYILNLPPVSVRNMEFVKTPNVKMYHDKMRIHLNSVATGIQQSLAILKSDVQELNAKATQLENKKGHLLSLVTSTKDSIEKFDNDELLKVSEDSVDNPYFFFDPVQEKVLNVASPHPIDETRSTLGDRRCFWAEDVVYGEMRRSAIRKIRSHFCGGVAGTLVAFVKSRVMNETKIKRLQTELKEYETSLASVEIELTNYYNSTNHKGTQIEQFAKRAAQAGVVSGKLYGDTMPLTDFLKSRKLFVMDQSSVEVLVKFYCHCMKLESDFLS